MGNPAITRVICAVVTCLILVFDVNAAVNWSGDIDPSNPLAWNDAYTGAYIGKTSTGTLNITSGSSIECRFAYVGYERFSKGIVTVNGSSARLTMPHTMYVGCDGNGTLEIAGGGRVTCGNVMIGGGPTSRGVVSIDGIGSRLNNSGDLEVGIGGNATLDITNGGVTNSIDAKIGDGQGSTGTVLVDGAGSTWTNSGDLDIGYRGNGELTVSNSGVVDVQGMTYLGGDGGNGTIHFDGGVFKTGSLLVEQGSLTGNGTIETHGKIFDEQIVLDSEDDLTGSFVYNSQPGQNINVNYDLNGQGILGAGESGSGSLLITGGLSVSSTQGYIGYKAGSTGTVMVEGSDSKWINNDSLLVGGRGNGTLAISNGGTVSNTTCVIGYMDDAVGVVTVDGTGSNWTNESLSIRSGSLDITNGGSVTAETGSIDTKQDDTTAVLTVDGAGSNLTVISNSSIGHNVGYYRNGVMNITGGGSVNSSDGYIGYRPTGEGTVTVDGAGSSWTNIGELNVGHEGTGVLHITDGGTVSAGKSTWVGRKGGTGVINFENGTLTTGSLIASPDQLTGIGTINTHGMVFDSYVLLDSDTDSQGTIVYGGTKDKNIEINYDFDGNGVLGAGYRNNGTLVVKNGVQVSSTDGYIGYNSGSFGTVIVEDSESKWHINNPGSASSEDLYIGYYGVGKLDVKNGGYVHASDSIYLGYEDDSVGTADVDGAGSKIMTYSTDVGYNGNGTLNITDNAAAIISRTTIGKRAGSTGTVTVNGSGSYLDCSTLIVGDNGNGNLHIGGGASVVSSRLPMVGSESGSTGVVTVEGAGSNWTIDANITVGEYGDGTLNIINGGRVTNKLSNISYGSSATSLVNVDGTGSKWTSTRELRVGRSGTGRLNVTNGGSVKSYTSSVGGSRESTGIVTVDGIGSNWSIDTALQVGYYGNGELSITDGGFVDNRYSTIGYDDNATGTVTVDGEGAVLINRKWLIVGYNGNADLSITNGGLVKVGTTLTINYDGTGDDSIYMSTGGMLALMGSGADSLTEFLDMIDGEDSILYWDYDIENWASITGATFGEDYTLEFIAEGALAGYTLLTVGVVPEPATSISLIVLSVALIHRRRKTPLEMKGNF